MYNIFCMISFQPRNLITSVQSRLSGSNKQPEQQRRSNAMVEVHPKTSLNDMILSANPYTSRYYYVDRYTSGKMGATKAIEAYALSNVPFYSYYKIYDKVRHKEVSRDEAIRALLINTLAQI